jgi:two-component system phosphate regulon sensor histidine kinase PhoR
MTHEFKTPLSSILIASNYLIKQDTINSDEKLEKYTRIVINQSNKLNQHIEKILNIAKSDNSPLTLDKKSVLIIPIITDVIENIQLKYPNINVQIDKTNNDYNIETDEFHFTNLVYNLIDNSIKYCEVEPEISIRLSEDNKHLKIEFVDNGIGVSNKNISYIFDKFYRIPSAKSNEVNGFGLGLYYVKKICTLHHWKINAKNNLKNGITITILIPKKNG